MIRLVLVTGFLGSGKTTFLKGLLSKDSGERLSLIINEFGRIGVDGALLSPLTLSLREVAGGSIFCACRLEEFENALQQAAAENPDLILVEASGLSDPAPIRSVLARHPQIAYQGCVALCDATRVEKVMASARVSLRQLSVSNLILLNKTDLVPECETARLTAMLLARFPLAKVLATTQGRCPNEWLESLSPAGEYVPHQEGRDVTLQKASISLSSAMDRVECLAFIRLFAEETYRIKGFVRLYEGWFLADCVGAYIQLQPCGEPPAGQESGLTALAGQGMELRKALREAAQWYKEYLLEIRFG